jgi:hypothetical protein
MAAALRSSETKLAVVTHGAGGQPERSAWRLPALARGRSAARHEWPAAALLAASLVVGVMLGSEGTVTNAVQQVAEVTGLSTAGYAGDGSQVAYGDEIVAFADEDLL